MENIQLSVSPLAQTFLGYTANHIDLGELIKYIWSWPSQSLELNPIEILLWKARLLSVA